MVGGRLLLTDELRRMADPIWEEIHRHPFVVELYAGRLPLERFRYYLLQDYSYIVNLTRALALAAAKAPGPQLMKEALALAHGEVTEEMASYESLLRELGLGVEEAARAEPNSVNVGYSSFMLSTCSLEGFYQCMTALLPCFWSYAEIAERHRAELESNPVPIYRRWASEYLSEGYRSLVSRLREVVDSSGLRAAELWPYFRRASLYELEFWEAAYEGR
ncbi:MAG: putative transcription activator [uncultured Acidilobus sp. MG]|nr:MAG: putative transcription activator [uncultured Acidilobus sp. MG]